MKTIAAYLVLVFFAGTALSESISENLAWNKEFSEKLTLVFAGLVPTQPPIIVITQ